jgi:SSS family solute:Na+ symporter
MKGNQMQLTHIVPLLAPAAASDGQPASGGMTLLDWIVIALYALGMLAVGWYYARRTSTTDDYLLGGRTMSPWKVGLSLFATLLSTLTYLALPGEMIKYGPMVLSQLVSMPFVALVVGWLLIPFIMRLRVTSAYEILETRFGLSVRLVGSSMFLTLRLFWMSLVIYATANTVLVPILGLKPSAVPWICVTLGLVTVAYTSLGGLRAVVLTDVLQTLIMFGGAILALIVITVQLGGVGQWWPHQWPAHWQPPVFWYDPQVRFTFVGGFLSMFTWHICTAGSDQMAIQRYLATRDARAARRMFNISLLANVLLWPFLAAVGLALLAYFCARPDLLPAGVTVQENADQLLPIFIVRGLPAGITGLVIAGLLAAAMSSLSSGLNSACSVITTDFIDRLLRKPGSEPSHVRTAKYVSLAIGVIVVALGVLVGQVEGNLLELCYKIANLLSVPLFLLFFMAMFVPWATSFGTLAGAACSAAVAVAVGYFQVFGLTFVWMMPAAFVAGASAGMLASLLPIGRKHAATN